MSIRDHAPLRRADQLSSKTRRLGSAALAVACVTLPGAVFAEDAAPANNGEALALPKMTVEGTRPDANPYADPAAPYKVDRSANGKYTEEIVNTPKTITVITKEQLKDMGTNTLREVVRTQPGVTIGTGEGGNAFGDRFYIRGFDARNDIFIDGMRDPGVLSRETFDLEQIEIAKGPGSTFAGRGSTGGAVNLISKAPGKVNFYGGEMSFGNADTKRFTVDLNQIVNDKLSFRVNGLYQDGGTPGRKYVEQERSGVAFAGLLKLTDDLRLTVDYYHYDMNGIPDYGMPWDTRTGQPFQGVPRDTWYGLIDRDFIKGRSEIVTAGLEWDAASNVEVRSHIRWGKTSNRYVVSAPESPPNFTGTNRWSLSPSAWLVSPNAKNRNSENALLANQTDATVYFDTGPLKHTFVGGLEISQETIFNRGYVAGGQALNTELGPGAPPVAGNITLSLLNPNNYLQVFADPYPGPAWSETNVVTAAVYMIDTIKIGEKWQILGGLRFDSYGIERRGTNLVTTTVGGVPTYSSSRAPDIENDSNFVNWNVGIVYKPVPAGTLYAAVGTSSNPAGDQVDSTADAYGGLTAGAAVLDPERTRSYEIGVKWELFDAHLLATAALFRTEKDNARLSGVGTSGVLATVGKVRAQGVELGLTGRITPKVEIAGGLVILDPKVVASPTPSDVGKVMANVPRTTFSLLTNYLITPKLKIGAGAYYASKNWGGRLAASQWAAPEYWRFDANASYELTDHVRLRLNVMNLTDKVYYDGIYASAQPFSYIAPGRQILGSIAVMF